MRTVWVAVEHSSHTAEVRRAAVELASSLNFSETETGNVALVATEATRNLLKHAGGGDVILRGGDGDGPPMVELLALDKGPGIANISQSFQDGYSTAGTPGTGLGAISRVSSLHDIYSQPRQGTALLVQISRHGSRAQERAAAAAPFQVGAVSVAMPGESVCGDSWAFSHLPRGGARLIIADGLGHGLLASEAANEAARLAVESPTEAGVTLLDRIHAALRPTRGAAVAVADVDGGRLVLRYTGIGNISGSIVSPDGAVQHLVSHSGTVGHEVRKIAEFTYRFAPGCLLVMHSDGLASHWLLEKYPGLALRHPSLIAGILYRDFSRRRDDATVVVLRHNGGAA
ncbi:MAG TPA: ATP-binding SpoIIE family protein phosphatase [Bryobacteraceae bacterium]|nr:ATP-binding SpoIIE family protein phosphatase [Bryobacteraceae bacterium]